MEQNQIGFFNPENGTMTPLVRDARISWVDTSEFAISAPLVAVAV
jgi:hypothetical protein